MSAQPNTTFRILHFNDVYHVSAGDREPVGGAARFGSIMHSLQQDGSKPPALTLFSGDAYFPSLESSISRGEHMLPVLNALNIDASTFGNHEFDQGIDRLEGLIKRNNFPWVITNLTDKETGGPAARGSVSHHVSVVNGLRVGIIGIIEKEWLDTLPCLPPTFEYHDFVQSAREAATRLRNRDDPEMSCDLVVCLSHMRLPNDIRLADECSDIVDIVLSGHDHFYYIGSGIDEFSDPDGEWIIPVTGAEGKEDEAMIESWKKERSALAPGATGRRLVKSGTDFRDLSEITFEVATTDTGSKTVAKVSVTRVRTTSKAPENPEIKDMVTKIEDHLGKALDKVIGFTTVPWDARSTVCRVRESNIGNLSADLMRLCYAESAGAHIGFLCGGAIRSDTIYPEGQIRLREIMNIFPFEDPVVVVKLTGDQIRRALENGVSKWPAQEGRFPQVSGIRFEFDPSREPGDRVTSIVITASAKAAAKRAQNQLSNDDNSELPKIRPSASSKSGSSMHRIALENTISTSGNGSPKAQGSRRSSDVSSIFDSESDVESDYGGEEDELLDMNAEYVVATRDYMYQGHDGYEALNEGELIVDEENGITFADLYRRFFRGLAVSNAFKFKKHGYAGSCSLLRHNAASCNDEKPSGKSEWKRLIIKHADDLRELAHQKKQEAEQHQAQDLDLDLNDQHNLASRIASIVQQYHEGLASKAQLLTHHSSNIIRALLSSARRLNAEQDPMRIARTALFGHDDSSSLPISNPDTPILEGDNAPRNDDAGGLFPELPINRKDTRSYASEELLAKWAVVSPQLDGRIKNVQEQPK
ncbi:hypothetical protein LPJ53_003878 [Coemansia erecta]|uniref:Metallo-dependent phosphatase n=1 Tax=Coemansia erecta TaxID=147472 RepID=A0A9W7XYC9_9FUNG|nr:hypothetical protein LPJ53_003878 [Coemansia erecta]